MIIVFNFLQHFFKLHTFYVMSSAMFFLHVSRMELHWYRQRVGDKLQRIVTLWQSTTPKYEPEFSESRWEITVGGNLCNLTITKTVEEDEGTYHCAFVEWINTEWSATYLLVKGKYVNIHETKCVQETSVCSGSEAGHKRLNQTSSTPTQTAGMNVAEDLTLRGAAFIVSLKPSPPPMLGFTTAPWPHVGR
uniref:Immunoglobulin V-set domain-containing protein n=1 Tax=Salarias fasciatus TaxID=181472 RepID=A0A672IQM9_SALFA